MVHVKQIVYKVETYNQKEPLSTKDNTGKIIDISKNIFLNNEKCIKLGIQAPPGTEFILNETKNIIVGRNGIYEIDENILGDNIITSLKFKNSSNLRNIIVDYLYT